MEKQNKGITLVALVITIIVLIILAGVSINAVMNGGLITNAKDAKNEYQEGKKEEETALIDFEITTDFATKVTQGYGEGIDNISKYTPYLFRNGYLTGLTVGDTVETCEKKLPQGYYICNTDGTSIEDKTSKKIATGLTLKVGENEETAKEKGKVVVYGDIDGTGQIISGNSKKINDLFLLQDTTKEFKDKYKDYQRVAMDVDHDSIISKRDADLINDTLTGVSIEQNIYAPNNENLKIIDSKILLEEYLQELSKSEKFKNSSYSIEYSEEYECYVLKGATTSTTAQALLNVLPKDTIIKREEDIVTAEVESYDLIVYNYYEAGVVIGIIEF